MYKWDVIFDWQELNFKICDISDLKFWDIFMFEFDSLIFENILIYNNFNDDILPYRHYVQYLDNWVIAQHYYRERRIEVIKVI